MLKKSLAVAALAGLLVAGTTVAAPGDDAPRSVPDKRAEMIKKRLGLTDEQSAKVDAIMEESMKKMQAIHDETRKQLSTVLTPEQQQKLDEMRQRGPRGGGPDEGEEQGDDHRGHGHSH